MNKEFNINEIIEILKNKRKIFTSEADLQLEMAQAIKRKYKDDKNVIVRLEYCPDFDSKMHIDILVIINGKWIPIELKYKTKELKTNKEVISYDDEYSCRYKLKNHSAHDCGCYDYLKDICRIEKIRDKKLNLFEKGYAIFITNDTLYKKGPRNNKVNYARFALKNDITIEKEKDLSWGKNGSSSQEREKPIKLKSKYKINWEEFSDININVDNSSNKFFILINEINKDEEQI